MVNFTIFYEVCGGKMLIAKELPGKVKQVELHHNQQDNRHVPKKKVLDLVKVLSILYTHYGGV